jgi:hypothetical protein
MPIPWSHRATAQQCVIYPYAKTRFGGEDSHHPWNIEPAFPGCDPRLDTWSPRGSMTEDGPEALQFGKLYTGDIITVYQNKDRTKFLKLPVAP